MTEQDVRYLAVIEGGGSTCRGTLFDLYQNRATTPIILNDHPCNIYREPELTLRSLRKMIESLGAQACPLTLCLPGISHLENVLWLKDQLKADGFETVHVASDAVAALLGAYEALEGGQGIFIGGTGVLALGFANGQLWRVGTPDTEKACGPWIARKAMALSATDPELGRIFGSAPDLADAPNHVIGLLAPAVFRAADAGNLTARAILHEAAESAADHMNRLKDFGVERFALCGTVATRLQPLIPVPTLPARGNGLDGAVKLALSVYKNPAALSLLTDLRRIEDEKQGQKTVNQ